METLYAVVYFCAMETCAIGWIDEPFQDKLTCTAYSQLYVNEMQTRAPESSGEILCVEKDLLQSAMSQFDFIELKKLDDIPSIN